MRILKFEKKSLLVAGFVFLFFICSVFAQTQVDQVSVPEVELKSSWTDKFEVEVHYAGWSLNLLRGLFEDDLKKELGEEIRKEITKEIQVSHPYISMTTEENSLAFDSSGSNYGLEIRFYPQGKNGVFSLGLSFEKTHMRIIVDGPVKQNFSNNTYAQVDAHGYVDISPFSTNLSFRWDFVPSWRVTPYFVFGLGIASLNGEIGYDYIGTYEWAGPQEEVSDSEVKDLKTAEEDFEFNIPNIIPIIQANLGVRAQIIPHLHLRLEAGIWNGIVFRGGIAYRF